jgi:hypothetical protein
MGAGHLNASRAYQQLDAGEFATGAIPLIGWNYGFIDDPDNPNKYVLNQMLNAGDYVSITLAWDRELALDTQNPPFEEYKPGDQFFDNRFYNLDLHILPAGSTDEGQAISSSTSTVDNLEHIFASIPATGNYEIWVQLNDEQSFASENYALAWWAGPNSPPSAPGDYDSSGSVGPEDYGVWRANFGSTNAMADGNGNGIVDAADYVIWRKNAAAGSGSFAAVPEPSGLGLLAIALASVSIWRSAGRQSARS